MFSTSSLRSSGWVIGDVSTAKVEGSDFLKRPEASLRPPT
jgi:hypothetical protein